MIARGDFVEFIRTFIAIELTHEVQREMDLIQDRLNLKKEPGVKPVNPESTHLTLRFLGPTPADKIEEIRAAIQLAAENVRPFALELKGVGCFPNNRSPRVIWVGLAGEETMMQLQTQLEDSLAELLIKSETRPFSAHLTLARIRDDATPASRRRVGEAVENMAYEPGFKFPVDHVSFIKSVLKPAGPEYSILHRIDLTP